MSLEKPVLVTGCAGFIGFHLALRLLGEGRQVVGLDNVNDYYDVTLKWNRLKQLQASPILLSIRWIFRTAGKWRSSSRVTLLAWWSIWRLRPACATPS